MPDGANPSALSPILVATRIGKSYGTLRVLEDVDFTVHAHEAVGIVGPNGAGKTTLLNVISGATPASAGTVAWQGSDVSRLGSAQRCRRGIARSYQVPRPFGGMTVLENLHVAASTGGGLHGQAATARCIEALELSHMTRLANRRAETLGLLDRKRLELARALATGPALLLLDEIGGGLTDAEADELVLIIKALRDRGIAIVWIEHIVHVLLRVITRLVCMDAGRVIADGPPTEVLESAAVVDAYLGARH